MDVGDAIVDPARKAAGTLERAEDVLVTLHRCTIDAAFNEIMSASRRHGLPTVSLARALVALFDDAASDDDAAAAAWYEWGSLVRTRGENLAQRIPSVSSERLRPRSSGDRARLS